MGIVESKMYSFEPSKQLRHDNQMTKDFKLEMKIIVSQKCS